MSFLCNSTFSLAGEQTIFVVIERPKVKVININPKAFIYGETFKKQMKP